MTHGGSGDLKIKLYHAVREVIGPDPINARLRRTTWGIYNLLKQDFPSNLTSAADRFISLRDKLVARVIAGNAKGQFHAILQ
jgi:hypothetical protein